MLNLKIPNSRAMKYGYSNARVKGMKGSLIRGSSLEELIKVNSIPAMIELLQKSDYKKDIADASVNYEGSAIISAAASQNFARTVRKLIKICPKEDKKIMQALLIRWDLANLKTILHAKKIGKVYTDINHLLYCVGGLNEDEFKQLMSAEGDLLLEIKKSKLGEFFNDIKKGSDLFNFIESEIDSKIYKKMDGILKKDSVKEVSNIRIILKKEIDAKNILIIERLKKQKIDRSLLIEGGSLNSQFINKIKEAKDLQQVVSLVKSKFRKLELIQDGTLADLEIALERSIAEQKKFAFQKDILSLGVIIGFLLIKEEEVNNLRKIAKGKEYGLTENEIRSIIV